MFKIALKFGLIAGALVSAALAIGVSMSSNATNMAASEGIGFASMFVSFALMFIATRQYRDRILNGEITFGKAFTFCLLFSFIVSTMYVVTWAVDYNFVVPGFMDTYSAQIIAKAKSSGAPQSVIDEKIANSLKMKEYYKNPLYFTLITYGEILPMGIFVSLIAAAVYGLRKKTPANKPA